ncbi:MAG: hypothetical protein ACRCSF_10780 [Mycobacteriaceae bacterium]
MGQAPELALEIDALLSTIHASGVPREVLAQISQVRDRLTQPISISVLGRPGVGVSSVARVLNGQLKHTVVIEGRSSQNPADIDVFVLHELPREIDLDAISLSSAVVAFGILNKADLMGYEGYQGPWSAALDRSNLCAKLSGIPVFPLISPLARAVVSIHDMEIIKRCHSGAPPLLHSPDLFIHDEHEVPIESRKGLVEKFDLYGIRCAMGAVKRNESTSHLDIQEIFRSISGISTVVEQLRSGVIRSNYVRIREAIDQLNILAAQNIARNFIERFIASEVLSAIKMQAAEAMALSYGLSVRGVADADQALDSSRYWAAYGSGPVLDIHQKMAEDLVQTSLRRWAALSGRAQI